MSKKRTVLKYKLKVVSVRGSSMDAFVIDGSSTIYWPKNGSVMDLVKGVEMYEQKYLQHSLFRTVPKIRN